MITAAPAPAGFLDMCRRLPQECRAPGEADDARIRNEAQALYWREAFGAPRTAQPARDAGSSTATAEIETPNGATLVPQAISVDLGGAVSDLAPDFDGGFTELNGPDALHFDASGDDAEALSMTPERWALVNTINQQVNRSIRSVSDPAHYGRADYWAPQSGRDQSGDCEDYALTKRHQLIEAGIPSQVLSFAIVRTSWGELHAVLILSTQEGDMVLDNLTPWIVRWDKTPYVWIERQMPGRPLEWRSVG